MKSQNFEYERRNFYAGIHEDLRNNNYFYLNVSEWLASPGGTKLSKLIEKMSKKN